VSATERDPTFDQLLDFLHQSRGFDFGGYKQTSLERRFRRRMEAIGCRTYGDYLDYLQVHPEEYEELFDALLINVTEFFRDRPAWEHLSGEVLPRLLEGKREGEPIRVWSAGCASGEEAYTVAIVLAEALGEDAYQERVKIYATDVDESALTEARQAIYPPERVDKVPPELRERYFERVDKRMAFRKDLRRSVIYGRNDLVSDAPISRLDLLVCRNTLMYFTAEAQERILRHFHFALLDSGVLMLGKSEMMIAQRELFEPVDLRRRIFRKRERLAALATRLNDLSTAGPAGVPIADDERLSGDAAFEIGLSPQVVVSRAGALTLANLAARALFGLGHEDIGRQLTELDLAVELRAPIEEVLREGRRVRVGEVRYKPPKGEERRLDVTVTPLAADGSAVRGVSVVFEDVSRYAAMQRELEGNRRDLELAYEELQSTIDELETTNEELQSANEELQTTNEELQSTNEELETMNEELQSTNEELETINDELRDRTSELNNVNDFLEAILTSLGLGVAVVDRQQRVMVWNNRAEDLWGLRPEEAIEHHLLSLDIGLPVEQLAAPLRAVLGGSSGRERAVLEAVNRRGRTISCATTILPLSAPGSDGDVRGAIVLMEDGKAG
jgi:two-component system, chemotaxis family, CheB/CheR fusion protein